MKKQKIAFHTLGCKLNFSETSAISRSFSHDGFEQVGFDDQADIYVINSCSVTKNAEKRCKAFIRQAIKRNPQAFVAVVGCYSQINPEELKKVPGVGLVLGNAEKFNLFEHIKRVQQHSSVTAKDSSLSATEGIYESGSQPYEPLNKFVPSWSAGDRTRSFFKIQDGCDYFCSYCTIPMARGRSRSDTITGTLQMAKQIAQTNVKEIVLSGVNIGDFGKQHNERFVDLLKELVKIEGIERIRISSVEPDLLHDDIIHLVAAHPKLMPHFHIPLQAGSDDVLKAMRRRYDTSLFLNRVDSIRRLIPDACIAVDLIVGFPTETNELFEASYQFIRNLEVSYIHVFTYSDRELTKAQTLPDLVDAAERHERSKKMHELSSEKKRIFYLQNQGKRATVLWENNQHHGFMTGFTENYLKAKTQFDPSKVNQLQTIVLNNIETEEVYLV